VVLRYHFSVHLPNNVSSIKLLSIGIAC
jgi:hypothetical protein